jgi:hypothetical protein
MMPSVAASPPPAAVAACHHRLRSRDVAEVRRPLPRKLAERDHCSNGEFRRCRDDDRVRSAGLERRHLRAHVGIGDFVRSHLHDLGGLRAKPLLQPGHVVLAEVVVLIEDCDLCVRLVCDDVLTEDDRLGLIIEIESERPGIFRVVGAPRRRAGRDEQLRNFLIVEVLTDGEIGRRAERVEERENVILLHQSLDELHGLRGIVTVVLSL